MTRGMWKGSGRGGVQGTTLRHAPTTAPHALCILRPLSHIPANILRRKYSNQNTCYPAIGRTFSRESNTRRNSGLCMA